MRSSPENAHAMWWSISTIFSMDVGSIRELVILFSTARMTPSLVCIPIAVLPSLMASMAYSTWNNLPSGEKVFGPRSYSDLLRNILIVGLGLSETVGNVKLHPKLLNAKYYKSECLKYKLLYHYNFNMLCSLLIHEKIYISRFLFSSRCSTQDLLHRQTVPSVGSRSRFCSISVPWKFQTRGTPCSQHSRPGLQ